MKIETKLSNFEWNFPQKLEHEFYSLMGASGEVLQKFEGQLWNYADGWKDLAEFNPLLPIMSTSLYSFCFMIKSAEVIVCEQFIILSPYNVSALTPVELISNTTGPRQLYSRVEFEINSTVAWIDSRLKIVF